jgi:NhaA family Na+:H+ antiporter
MQVDNRPMRPLQVDAQLWSGRSMNQHPQAGTEVTRLPRGPLDRFRELFARYTATEAAAGFVLFLFTVSALALSNSPWAAPYSSLWETRIGIEIGPWEHARSLRDWINDGLMTLFFFLVSLELKRQLVLGELRNPRMAALSIAAALGGMLAPATLYLLIEAGGEGRGGWGTVMATDTAFVIGCLALLGARIPQSLRVFMLSLAIVDDLGAIVVVAIGYGSAIDWAALTLAGIGIAVVRMMSALGVRSFPVYFALGAVIWLAVDACGIHPTVTGVILGLMTPARRWVSDERLYSILGQVIAHPDSDEGSGDTKNRETLQAAEIAARESMSATERLEIALHPWVGFVILPIFALANAGVPLAADGFSGSIVLAVLVGFVVGKPVGILTFSWIAVRMGIAMRPAGLGWGALAGAGMLAGIGFTMALFIAQLAFREELIDSAKLGILLASVVSAVSGLGVLAWVTRGRRHPEAPM